MIKIEIAKIEDSNQIAILHKKYINQGFLSSLGLSFLNLLYNFIISSNNSFCIIAKDNNKIVGFVSFSKNTKELFKSFIKKYFLKIYFILFLKLFNLDVLKQLFETLIYPKKINQNIPEAELLSIVVIEEYQGKGISRLLFNEMKNKIITLGIDEFKVIVGQSLIKANKFYQNCGAIKIDDIEIHKNKKSNIYKWKNINDK